MLRALVVGRGAGRGIGAWGRCRYTVPQRAKADAEAAKLLAEQDAYCKDRIMRMAMGLPPAPAPGAGTTPAASNGSNGGTSTGGATKSTGVQGTAAAASTPVAAAKPAIRADSAPTVPPVADSATSSTATAAANNNSAAGAEADEGPGATAPSAASDDAKLRALILARACAPWP